MLIFSYDYIFHQPKKSMDTEKLKIGWAIAVISKFGIHKEKSKLRRWLIRQGFQQLERGNDTYVRSSVAGQAGMEKIAHGFRDKKFIEVSLKMIYVTRAQWERSYVLQGLPVE